MKQKRVCFVLWQCSWGLVQTLVGLLVFLICMKNRHFYYHGAVATEWDSPYSASLGLFIFVAKPLEEGQEDTQAKLLVHEYGHCIQSLLLGPLYLILVGLPSQLWCMLPVFVKLRKKREISYYSFYTESWASLWGERIIGEEAMR